MNGHDQFHIVDRRCRKIQYHLGRRLSGTGERIMRDEVQAALERVRPTLQQDGGDVVLVDVTEEGVVKVQLTGACKSCPMSQMTLKDGIEKFLKSEVPGIKAVESV